MKKNEEKNKDGVFFAVIGVATLAIAIMGATFAWYTASDGGEVVQVVKTGILSIDYLNGTSNIYSTNMKPSNTADVIANQSTCVHPNDVNTASNETICAKHGFTIKNTGNLDAIIDAYININQTFTSNSLKYIIVEGNTATINDPIYTYDGNFQGLPSNVRINAEEEKSYTIIFWLDGTIATNQDQEKVMTGQITVDATQVNVKRNSS
ncbi:MAG: hypothetical protein Q4G04_00015 [bacterium]|nr:hypothetical protein [bacterium]